MLVLEKYVFAEKCIPGGSSGAVVAVKSPLSSTEELCLKVSHLFSGVAFEAKGNRAQIHRGQSRSRKRSPSKATQNTTTK